MCAIFELTPGDEAEIRSICETAARKYGEKSAACTGRDIFPGGTAIISGGTGKAALMRWGFPLRGSSRPVFNARAENLAQRPLFRPALRHRCLVPVTSFYEFDRSHRRYRIFLPARPFFYLAGLWAPFRRRDGSAGFCFTIVTTAPNRSIGAFHDRMPAVLTPETVPLWLSGTPESLAVLRPLEETTDIQPAPPPHRR